MPNVIASDVTQLSPYHQGVYLLDRVYSVISYTDYNILVWSLDRTAIYQVASWKTTILDFTYAISVVRSLVVIYPCSDEFTPHDIIKQ